MNSPNNKLPSAGVGFVVIPEDVEEKDYILDCYRMRRISMNGGYGHGIYRNVSVPNDVIQQIKFPEIKGKYGSAVVWVKDGISNLPVVVACLSDEDDYFSFSQNKFKRTVQSGDSVIDLIMDANRASLQINITDDGNSTSEYIIKLTGKNKKSVFKVISDNDINLLASNSVNITTNKEVNVKLIDSENKIKGSVNFNIENGLSVVSQLKTDLKVNDSDDKELVSLTFDENGGIYKDKNSNEITIENGKITVKSKAINLGNGGSPIPLGDKLIDLIGQICDAISTISVPTAVGPSGPPINSPQFTVIKSQLNSALSQLSKTD
jgi:hypothetical protein